MVALNGDRREVRPEYLKVVACDELLTWNRRSEKVSLKCAFCGQVFEVYPVDVKRRAHCSQKCAKQARRKLVVARDELAKLVWEIPLTQLADRFGVSDKAVAKRCKKLGIITPGRGYWRKLETGKIDSLVDNNPNLV